MSLYRTDFKSPSCHRLFWCFSTEKSPLKYVEVEQWSSFFTPKEQPTVLKGSKKMPMAKKRPSRKIRISAKTMAMNSTGPA